MTMTVVLFAVDDATGAAVTPGVSRKSECVEALEPPQRRVCECASPCRWISVVEQYP